ncbi:zinc finger protein 182 [Anabrus simplex]|uniref:zinc finger protein 182 n=1 Tax=Anabrus simplex TaxID=316456 RepID=UPI0035A38431
MEETVFVKCEPDTDTEHSYCGILSNNVEEPVFVKCEPIWSSDTEEHSNVPSEDIKEEMFGEQHQLVPSIKEKNSVEIDERLTVHTREGLHNCSLCGMTFNHISDIVEHKLSHSDENPRLCRDGSTLPFRNSTSKGHKPSGECKRTLVQKTLLETRKRRQPDERPYYCELCNSTFKRRSNLRNHMVVHSGERPFSCDLCNKKFTQKSALLIHTRLHTGEKPHRCEQCSKAFSDKGSLQSHSIYDSKRKIMYTDNGTSSIGTDYTPQSLNWNQIMSFSPMIEIKFNVYSTNSCMFGSYMSRECRTYKQAELKLFQNTSSLDNPWTIQSVDEPSSEDGLGGPRLWTYG